MADRSTNAGGSTARSSEDDTKNAYDEELDFLSPKFNPERALHSPNVLVPYPHIKSFETIKSYEDTVKRRQLRKSALKPNIVTVKKEQEHSSDTPTSINPTERKSHKTIERPSSSCETSLRESSIGHDEQQSVGQAASTSTKLSIGEENPNNNDNAKHYTSIESKELSTRGSSTSYDSPPDTLIKSRKKSHSLPSSNETKLYRSGSGVRDNKLTISTPSRIDARPCRSQESTSDESIQSHKLDERPACSSSSGRERSHSTSSRSSQRQFHSSEGHERSSSYSHRSSRSGERSYKIRESTLHFRERIKSSNVDKRQLHASSSNDKSFSASRNPRQKFSSALEGHKRTSSYSHELSSRDVGLHKGHEFTSPELEEGEIPTHTPPSSFEKTLRISKQSHKLHQSFKGQGESSSNSQKSSVITSNYRPSSALSRSGDKQKQFYTREKERPSSYSARDRQESNSDISREMKHTGTQSKHQAMGSISLQVEVQKSHPTRRITAVAIEAHSDHEEGSSSLIKQKDRKCVRKQKNVFSRMESMTGPLHVLTRCVQERLLVRVMTRGAVNVRGICRGYVVAFDKHFNMAMIDVEEIYRRPAGLGKVKSRISHKLAAAQKTLQMEREESQTKWREEQEISYASSSFQDLSIQSDVKHKDESTSAVLKIKEELDASVVSTPYDQFHHSDQSLLKVEPSLDSTSSYLEPRTKLPLVSQPKQAVEEIDVPSNKISQVSRRKLRRIQSVYEGVTAPLSPFERESLMLGIPDENVQHRHINQLFLRGENVVSVSIVDDF